MSENIKAQLELLKTLSSTNEKYRKAIIKQGDKKLIGAICECIYNVLKGNVEIDPKNREILHKYRLSLRKLCEKSSVKQKKKILIQKGGFLRFLLPTVLSVISSIVTK